LNGELHLFFEQRPDDGYKNGLLTSWYPNGQKEYEGTFKDGYRLGKWTYYNEDGSLNEVVEHPSDDE
jgi:antitoxin component YwqK of YwqJK toxin-antitoxin module